MSSKPDEPDPDEIEAEEPEPPPVGLPEAVPDDWLDQKPFDPAGR